MTIPSDPFSPWPYFDDEQINAVADVLRSGKVNYWTGEQGRLFEQEYADYVGCRHGVAVANGTVALELALYALDIGAGDEVITTSRTYVASASCVVLRGATPVFADVDVNSQNLTVESIERVATSRTRAIIAVHLAGWPCDMEEIMAYAEKRGIKVIEDCAQAHGATYKGKQVGSMGHISAFSFCQDKIITTGGEGGMVVTNDEGLWLKMWAYKDHGKSWKSVYEEEHPVGFKWFHESFGTNWRITEMQAVLGRIQLGRLVDWSEQRRSNAMRIWSAAGKCAGLRVPPIPDYIEHAAYKCYVFVNTKALRSGWSRDKIMLKINELDVPCYSGSCSEVYLEKAFDTAKYKPATSLPGAKALGETSLMFLVHPTLTEDEVSQTCAAITDVMQEASS